MPRREPSFQEPLPWLPEPLDLSPTYESEKTNSGFDSQHNPSIQREVFPSLEPQQTAETLHEELSSRVQPSPVALLTMLHLLILLGKDCGRKPGIPLSGNRHNCQEPVCWPQSPVVSVLVSIENWKATEFGRAGREPQGRVSHSVMVNR